MQTNHVAGFTHFTSEIFIHFDSFLSPQEQIALSQTSKGIRACAEDARRIRLHIDGQKLKKQFGSVQELASRIVFENKRLAEFEFQLFNNQNSFLGVIVQILSCKACVLLKIMNLFFYIFPPLKRCANEEIQYKKCVQEQGKLISTLRDIQVKFNNTQSFSESEIIELLGFRKEFDLLPRLQWTNPETKEIDLDYVDVEHLKSAYTKGIDCKGRKFLIIRHKEWKTNRVGLQVIYQSARNSRFWKTLCRGCSLLQTSEENIDRDFIHTLKAIIAKGRIASHTIF